MATYDEPSPPHLSPLIRGVTPWVKDLDGSVRANPDFMKFPAGTPRPYFDLVAQCLSRWGGGAGGGGDEATTHHPIDMVGRQPDCTPLVVDALLCAVTPRPGRASRTCSRQCR